jgi:predicted ATPase
MLNSLSISNFRGFEMLELGPLQRVNLIVGRNNAGKTSLLEAVAFLASYRQQTQFPQILRPVSGNVENRYFRWLMKDAPDITAARIDASDGGIQRQALFLRNLPPGGVQQLAATGYQSVHASNTSRFSKAN